MELNSKNLKDILWKTLLEIREGKRSAKDATAIAAQAKEIIRTNNLELRVAEYTDSAMSKETTDFFK